MYSLFFLVGTAFVSCLLLTPLVRAWSQRNGWLDHPDMDRKVHQSPIPRTGGVAIVVSYVIAVGLLLLSPLKGATVVDLPLALRLLPAVLAVFFIGLADDLLGLNPRQKLIGQAAAACLAWWSGIQILGIGGFSAGGWWSLPVTVFWLVGCANAVNLIDGVDGLAAGIGLFATVTTLAAALLQGNAALALATAPLLGALLAFLRYNFNPASIFLGDCGSLTIGFLIGCFGIIWCQKSATALGMFAPLMALAVPLLDTAVSVVRRFLRHQPVFKSDRNHMHHRLLDRGFSPRQVALTLYAACGVGAAFSMVALVPHNRFDGLVLVVFCVAAWVGVQLLGYVEFDAARHLVLTGTFRHILNARLIAANFERKIAAARSADDCWDIIREVGREFGCSHIRMAITGAVYQDDSEVQDASECCTIRIALVDGGYVNFRYYVQPTVRCAIGISSIIDILQRSLAASNRGLKPAILAQKRPALPLQQWRVPVEQPEQASASTS